MPFVLTVGAIISYEIGANVVRQIWIYLIVSFIWTAQAAWAPTFEKVGQNNRLVGGDFA